MGRLFLALMIVAAISLAMYSMWIANAQINWISSFSIRDLTDNRDLTPGEPLIAGHSYRITITIQVPQTVPGSVFTVSLNTNMSKAGQTIWNLESQEYPGIDQNLFTPASYSVSFRHVQGILRISATFSVPQNFNILYSSGGVVIRQPRDSYPVVTVFIQGGSTVGTISLRIVDSVIQSYEALYREKSGLISSGSVDRAYEPLINSLLSQASSLASQGLYDQAVSLLRSIDPRSLPQPPSTGIVIALGGAAAALGAVAAILFILMSRARASRDDALDRIRQARNRIAGMKVRAQKLDKVLAQEIEDLEKILGE
ncbi:MAG: hypothetical protein QXE01_06610 [Sulfolobales archaeon]